MCCAFLASALASAFGWAARRDDGPVSWNYFSVVLGIILLGVAMRSVLALLCMRVRHGRCGCAVPMRVGLSAAAAARLAPRGHPLCRVTLVM